MNVEHSPRETRFVDRDPDGEPIGLAVLLPGRIYPPGPALFFTTMSLLAHGWRVRQVWWEPPVLMSVEEDYAWVTDQLDRAVGDFEGRVLVVTKSLGSLAAPMVTERAYESIWLTPLLTEAPIAAALRDQTARQLTVIGTADPFRDPDALAACAGTIVEIPDADHLLQVPDGAVATAKVHVTIADAVEEWLAGS
jgi:hypothetical protein